MKRLSLKKTLKMFELFLMSFFVCFFVFYGLNVTVYADEPNETIEVIGSIGETDDTEEICMIEETEENDENEQTEEISEIEETDEIGEIEETEEIEVVKFEDLVLEEKSEILSFDEDSSLTVEDYIDDEVDKAQNPVYSASSLAGDRLTGNNKVIYDKCKIMIAEVANGKKDSATCTISLAELGLDRSYSAADLGLSSIKANTDAASDALYKVKNYADIDAGLIANALRSDCPYERYWMGLKAGHTGLSSIAEYDYALGDYRIRFTTDLEFKFEVNADYRGSGDTFSVNTNKTKAVKSSINRINDILNQAKNKSDREKIQFYKDQICALTEYNDAALSLPKSQYGDPWQLVYVFDGDNNTNVVCEGYSKAFMYLCDKSFFSDSSINCYIATGVMDGGGHMWNIVHWSDGINYMVDVTNCDSLNTNDLFMVLPVSGTVQNGYIFKVLSFYEIYYDYDEYALATYSTRELTVGDISSAELSNIFVDYDPFIESGKTVPFTVKREGGSKSCQFKLVSAVDANGNSIVSGSQDYGTNNVFNVYFGKEGKYTLKFSAKDGSTVLNETITVDVKNGSQNAKQVRAFVNRFYQTIQGREGEEGGLDFWTNNLLEGNFTGADVAKEFVLSDEFKGKNHTNREFLNIMYQAFFGRAADSEGFDFWVDNLHAGCSKEYVVACFVDSEEFTGICNSYGITRGDLDKNEGQPTGPISYPPLKMNSDNVNDAQLSAYVEKLYTTILDRPSEAEGCEYWKKAIKEGKGADAGTAAGFFFKSTEYRNKNKSDEEFLIDVYEMFFGRDPRATGDYEGYNYWLKELKEGNISRTMLVEYGFGQSNEFKGILRSYGFVIIEN